MENVKVSETVARCRECQNNEVPLADMAIFSWKVTYGGFTGYCLKCYLGDCDGDEGNQ